MLNKKNANKKLSLGIAAAALSTLVLLNNSGQVNAATKTNVLNQDQAVQTQTDKNNPKKDSNITVVSKNKNQTTVTTNDKTNSQTKTSDSESAADRSVDYSNDKIQEWKNWKAPDLTEKQKEEFKDALLNNKNELSSEQLKALGLDKNTYLENGVKVTVKAKWDFKLYLNTTKEGKIYKDIVGGSFIPEHNAHGDIAGADDVGIYPNPMAPFDLLYKYVSIPKGLNPTLSIIQDYKVYPVINGKTIYINQGGPFSVNEAQRGLDLSQQKANIKSLTFDNKINKQNNINPDTLSKTVGNYPVAIDITYANGTVSANVNVVVVKLEGKTITKNIGDSISTDPSKYLTGLPTGSKIEWAKDQPSTANAGTFSLPLIATYPDGNHGKTVATLIVKAPDNKPDPTPVIPVDPIPQPQPQPEPTPTPGEPTDDKTNIPKPLPTKEPTNPAPIKQVAKPKSSSPMKAQKIENVAISTKKSTHQVLLQAKAKTQTLLPQTGSKNNIFLTFLGGLITGLIALAMLTIKPNKNN